MPENDEAVEIDLDELIIQTPGISYETLKTILGTLGKIFENAFKKGSHSIEIFERVLLNEMKKIMGTDTSGFVRIKRDKSGVQLVVTELNLPIRPSEDHKRLAGMLGMDNEKKSKGLTQNTSFRIHENFYLDPLFVFTENNPTPTHPPREFATPGFGIDNCLVITNPDGEAIAIAFFDKTDVAHTVDFKDFFSVFEHILSAYYFNLTQSNEINEKAHETINGLRVELRNAIQENSQRLSAKTSEINAAEQKIQSLEQKAALLTLEKQEEVKNREKLEENFLNRITDLKRQLEEAKNRGVLGGLLGKK